MGERMRTHGMSETHIYKVWAAMRTRCGVEGSQSWHHYGARGITVDPRWETFENFYADMGDPPPGHSLERRDNDRGYSPENCYWATHTQQMRNNRRSRYVAYDGETLTVAEWAERLGMNYSTLYNRLFRAGWDTERAFDAPLR
jgi:hypothetical protein